MIYFVGAGPGAVDLITIRGLELLKKADILIYAGSLVNPKMLDYVGEKCEIFDSSRMTLEEIGAVFARAHEGQKTLVRLHTGDPSIYGAIREQMDILDGMGIPYEVCPGVSSFSAAAAALCAEYTIPELTQTVILSRASGRTKTPEKESLKELASHGASMVLFLSASLAEKVKEELLQGGYSEDTPCAIVYKASWDDERIIRGKLSKLPEMAAENGIEKTALILVGDFLEVCERNGRVSHGQRDMVSTGNMGEAFYGLSHRSRLYSPDFSTGYRKAAARADVNCVMHPKKISIIAFSRLGADRGVKLAFLLRSKAMETNVYAPERLSNSDEGKNDNNEDNGDGLDNVDNIENVDNIDNIDNVGNGLIPFNSLSKLIENIFYESDMLIFIGACGIAVRAVAPFIKHKTKDPGVLAIGEDFKYVISLLSGHIGGANAFAKEVASLIGAKPVITTGTDLREMFAVDNWAMENGLRIINPEHIVDISSHILDGKKVGLYSEYPTQGDVPECIEYMGGMLSADSKEYAIDKPKIDSPDENTLKQKSQDLSALTMDIGIIVADDFALLGGIFETSLKLAPTNLSVGMGCKRGTSYEALRAFLEDSFNSYGLSLDRIYCISSILNKANEDGLIKLANSLGVDFVTYSAEELNEIEGDFERSDFVRSTVGTDNVCQRSAALSSGMGEQVIPKQKRDGMTLSVYKRKIKLKF